MKIKITSNSPGIKTVRVLGVLNAACLLANGGIIPSPEDIDEPQRPGIYWHRDGNTVHLCGVANNKWAFIESETETSCEIRFKYWHDRPELDWAGNVCRVMAANFEGVEILED